MEREGTIKIHLEDVDKYWKEPYSTDKQLGCYVEMLKLNYGLVPQMYVIRSGLMKVGVF